MVGLKEGDDSHPGVRSPDYQPIILLILFIHVNLSPPLSTLGVSLLSLLQPLSGPSCPFVDFFFSFVDNPQLFQASVFGTRAPRRLSSALSRRQSG